MMGAERKSMIMKDEEKKATAYHEAGHALVSLFSEKTDPVHKVTIIPRGQALGVTSYLPEADRLSYDKERLTSRIRVSLGGRAAEELILNDFSTGVESDLKSATDLAYKMTCEWGMSPKLGALTIPQGNSGNYLAIDYNQSESVSEEIQQIVDQEVHNLVSGCYNEAMKILTDHKEALHLVAQKLLEVETISLPELRELSGLPPLEEKTEKSESESKDSDDYCF